MQLLKCAGGWFGSDDSARGTGPTIYVIIIAVFEFLGVSTSLSSSHSKMAATYLALVMYLQSRSASNPTSFLGPFTWRGGRRNCLGIGRQF